MNVPEQRPEYTTEVKLISNHGHAADRMTVGVPADADGVPVLSVKVVVVPSESGPVPIARRGGLTPTDIHLADGQPWAMYERMAPDADDRWCFFDTGTRVSAPRQRESLEHRPVRRRPPM